jgi:hypothetical protein
MCTFKYNHLIDLGVQGRKVTSHSTLPFVDNLIHVSFVYPLLDTLMHFKPTMIIV